MRRLAYVFLVLLLMSVFVADSQAVVPEGWAYHSGDYAYAPDAPGWFYFNAIDTQWVVDLDTGIWDTIENLDGWHYHVWSYVYSSNSGHWGWFQPGYSQWICELATGEWSIFGAPNGMVHVAGGTFTMGDTWGAGTTHEVTLDGFFMDWYEVTNQEMADVLQWAYDEGKLDMSDSNSVQNASGDQQELLDLDATDCEVEWDGTAFTVESGRQNHPCVEVSWYGAAAYCNYRSEGEGLAPCYDLSDWTCDTSVDGYRLPTEAEWEYAAKGGKDGGYTEYSGSDTVGDVAWHQDNSGDDSHVVGTKAANELGIYDMSGNVYEWCNDWHASDYYGSAPDNNPEGPDTGTAKVLRGGGWPRTASWCTVAKRNANSPDTTFDHYGFRCVR